MNRIYRWMVLSLSACCVSFALAAQDAGDVSGQVLDSLSGEPLIGVSVNAEEAGQGVATDLDGNFSLPVSGRQAVLTFSYLGYTPRTLEVQAGERVTVYLSPDNEALDEVVVVGYGTQKKVNLTGSVSVVEGEDLTRRQVASTSAALQGMAPGVMVTQQSGLPGQDAGRIRIRGISSMFAGQDPLVLVDNIEMSLDAIDPNNIESISILKDAAAASIYGSRAANGVILITTKRGEREGATVSYNTYAAWQQATNLPDKVDALEHMELYDLALRNVDRNPVFSDAIADYRENGPDNFSRFNTDWKDLILSNNGLQHNHNLNVSTSTDRISLFASGSYLRQNGLTANTRFERYDLRFNTDVKLFDNLTASMDLVLNRSDRSWPGASSPSVIISRMIGLPAYVPGQFDTGEYGEGWANSNPVAQAEASGFDESVTKSSILTGTLKYTPLDGLELLATYSANNWRPHLRTMVKQYQVYLPDEVNQTLTPGPLFPPNNSLNESRDEYVQNIFRTQATYSHDAGDHRIKLLGGFSAEDYTATTLQASRRDFVNPDMSYLNMGDAATMNNSGGISEWAILSFYSRLNYEFSDRYMLELNGRWDASSRFSKGNRWGFFPSVSAGWRISRENFWGSLENTIDEAKLRASYGVLGNQNLNTTYPTVSQFIGGYGYFFNNTNNSGYAISQAANPDIKWESSRQFDVGLDLEMLDYRLSITADYYRRKIYDMLQVLPIPILVGLEAPFVNAGSMENTGWEFSAGWQDRIRDFRYGITVNLSDVKNTVNDLHGEEYIDGLTIKREGYALDSYFGYVAEGIFQNEEEIENAPFHFANTRPGDIRYRDVSGPEGDPDGVIDNYDRVILGNTFPRYEYSINLDAAWRGFDLGLFFQGVGKRDNYMSGTGAWAFYSANFQGTAYEYHKDYWTPGNPGASYPRLTVDIDNNQRNSSYWLRSGAYLRLKNVILGYTLPASVTERIGVGSLRIYASGQNLFTWDDFYPGFDPEIENNNGQFYPIMKTYSLGLAVKF